MNLSTKYLGLELSNPLMPGASPMVDQLDTVRRLEDAGASAIVMHSLFEEQISREQIGTAYHMSVHSESSAEATSYFPEPAEYALGPAQYLEQIRRIRQTVHVPVIASLNGTTPYGWTDYATQIESAGADALELNLYFVSTDQHEAAVAVERRLLETVRSVKNAVTIPVAVKLSPFFTSLANFAYRLDDIGVDGLVLFNRFYQPDINIEMLEVEPRLRFSDSSELLLRLRWLAILSGRAKASLCVTGGVHAGQDAIKAIMAGAHAVQVTSALLTQGPGQLATIRNEMAQWLEEHEYESLQQALGSMNLLRCPDPAAFERGNYMKILQGWATGRTRSA